MNKQSFSRFARLVPILALVTVVMLVISIPVSGASVTPTEVSGNPSCVSLGYDVGFKIEPPNSGTYNITGTSSTVTISVDDEGIFFSWTSTLPMDAVIVKGGNAANVFVYDPPAEATHDEGLYSPDNPGGIAAISHIEFCFDYNLIVEKTVETSYTVTHNYDVEKSVTPPTLDLFRGDSGVFDWDIVVTELNPIYSDFVAVYTITVKNFTPFAAPDITLSDALFPPDSEHNCDELTSVAIGGTASCTYTVEYDLTAPSNEEHENTVTVVDNTSFFDTETASATAIFNEANATVTHVDEDYTLVDEYTAPNSDPVLVLPLDEQTVACDRDEGTHTNKVTIIGNDSQEELDSDTAIATLYCHELTVTKDADESLTRTWTWTIDKSADQADLTLSDGQLFAVNYTVEVSATASDSDWAVSGTISVANNTPLDAELTGVSDIVSPAVAATVDCGVTFPYILLSGNTLNCTYSAALPDDADRTNTATATIQNYDADGVASGTTDFSGTANVDFDGATVNEVDECVEVSDTNVGVLGTVCEDDVDKTFEYTLDFGTAADADVVLECGDNTHTNIADFVTNDTGATGDDEWTVNVTVECLAGCTLTQGYWKTHSENGPAPYDDTWALLPNGASTMFFSSGQSYYQVLWTPPRGGNAYYILAHQYIAAQLNKLNGASTTPQVDAAFAAATTLFQTYSPAQFSQLKGKTATSVRSQFLSLAGTLGSYNEGAIGPGHCDEDSSSASS